MLTSNTVWTTSSNLSNSIETPTSCNHVEFWISQQNSLFFPPTTYEWPPPSLDVQLVSSLSQWMAGVLPPLMNGPILPLADGLPSLNEWPWLASSLSRWMAGILPPLMNGPILPLADGLPPRWTASHPPSANGLLLPSTHSLLLLLIDSLLPPSPHPSLNEWSPPPSTNCPLLPSTNCLPLPLPCFDGQSHPSTNTLLLCVR